MLHVLQSLPNNLDLCLPLPSKVRRFPTLGMRNPNRTTPRTYDQVNSRIQRPAINNTSSRSQLVIKTPQSRMNSVDELTNSNKAAILSNDLESRPGSGTIFTAAALYTTLSIETGWPGLFVKLVWKRVGFMRIDPIHGIVVKTLD